MRRPDAVDRHPREAVPQGQPSFAIDSGMRSRTSRRRNLNRFYRIMVDAERATSTSFGPTRPRIFSLGSRLDGPAQVMP